MLWWFWVSGYAWAFGIPGMIADGGADLCDVERREARADGKGSGKEKGGR